ncbi:MAG: ATP-binding protein, partial [Bacteroidota bacterium]
LDQIPLGLKMVNWAATEVYLNGVKIQTFGRLGKNRAQHQSYNPNYRAAIPIELIPGKPQVLAIHIVDYIYPLPQNLTLASVRPFVFMSLQNLDKAFANQQQQRLHDTFRLVVLSLYVLLMIMIWLIVWRVPSQKEFLAIALFLTLSTLELIVVYLAPYPYWSFSQFFFIQSSYIYISLNIPITLLVSINQILGYKIDRPLRVFLIVYYLVAIGVLAGVIPRIFFFGNLLIFFVFLSYYIIAAWKRLSVAALVLMSFILASAVFTLFWVLAAYLDSSLDEILRFIRDVTLPIGFALFVAIRFQEIFQEEQKQTLKVLNLTQEKQEILSNQNKVLEQKVQQRTEELNTSLENLQATQAQLIQSEKLASLGELTAGIAHEIQNPLNFVNNFSEVNAEMLGELKEELEKGDLEEVKALAQDLTQNEAKILHHGRRAEGIVKGMLDHSRSNTGEKSRTDLNAMADEYLRLSYHGLRAKDNRFNAKFETDLAESLPTVEVVAQDIGRVLLNLINNAFYAVHQKSQQGLEGYEPKVKVSTKSIENAIEIRVEDNGTGMPDSVKEKIFQPFFTTKPTGQGTGLGLSLAYDIISKGHGGNLEVERQ